MNLFSGCGNNSCLWILILLLLAASCSGNGIEGVLPVAAPPYSSLCCTVCGKTARSPTCFAATTATAVAAAVADYAMNFL